MDQIEEAAIAGVRASELARRHLWSCNDCRAFQRDLRVQPSRLRKLASWSPWAVLAQLLGGGGKAAVGVCCALVVGGGAVTVPVVEHARHAPEPLVIATTDPVPVAPARPVGTPRHGASAPTAIVATPAPVLTSTRPATAAEAHLGHQGQEGQVPPGHRRLSQREIERRQFQMVIHALGRKQSPEERQQMMDMVKTYAKAKPGSRERLIALRALQRAAFAPKPIQKPVVTPTPSPAPTSTPAPPPPAPPQPTATPTPPPPPPVETPTATPTPIPTETPAPVVTPTP